LVQQKHNGGVMTMARFPDFEEKFSLFRWEIFPVGIIRRISGKVSKKIEKISSVF